MVQKEMPQAWWFDSHSLARPSPWLNNTLSELDDKTKQMLKMIDQDADSFAQRAEMYYKKRPVLVDMLGDLYRTHRSLAEQYDLLKHSNGTRQTVFGPASCTQSRSQIGSKETGSRNSVCSGSDNYDSESEVDDPEQEEYMEELSESDAEKAPQIQAEEVRMMLVEIEMLKEKNAELQKANAEMEMLKEKNAELKKANAEIGMIKEKNAELKKANAEIERIKEKNAELLKASAEIEMLKNKNAELQRVSEENTTLKAELAAKDEEKREVIRQLASSFDIVKKENCTLRECIKNSKSSSSSRGFDLKKLTKDLFSAKLFTAHCKATTGPMVVL
uniref:NAB domain-containing protein n=1 Tax=Leersia perrieri TaxID=77586 RepID=A0A0D9X2M3_9ORYZ